MTSPRIFSLLGSLALGSCFFIINGVDKRCQDDAILCADEDTIEVKCVQGREERNDCKSDEVCIQDVGCIEIACGNGFVDDGEDCDNQDLDGESCATIGFDDGVLDCNDDCTFDTAACFACGNGIAEVQFGGEECDDNNLTNNDGCDDKCRLEKLLFCNNNNEQEGPEFCDGDDLNDKDCEDLGFLAGELDCNGQCGFETDECTN